MTDKEKMKALLRGEILKADDCINPFLEIRLGEESIQAKHLKQLIFQLLVMMPLNIFLVTLNGTLNPKR